MPRLPHDTVSQRLFPSPGQAKQEPLSLHRSEVCACCVRSPLYDGCCLLKLISLSVWEPSAVCQPPCLTSMLISINYYGTWNRLSGLML